MTIKEASIISGMPECILRDMVKNKVLKRSNSRTIHADDLNEIMKKSALSHKKVPENCLHENMIEKRGVSV